MMGDIVSERDTWRGKTGRAKTLCTFKARTLGFNLGRQPGQSFYFIKRHVGFSLFLKRRAFLQVLRGWEKKALNFYNISQSRSELCNHGFRNTPRFLNLN